MRLGLFVANLVVCIEAIQLCLMMYLGVLLGDGGGRGNAGEADLSVDNLVGL